MFHAFFTSKGPEIELFGRLKSQWVFIDKSKFDRIDSDEAGEGCLNALEKTWLASRQADVVSNLRQHLEDVQPHEDYREFARLTLQLVCWMQHPCNCRFSNSEINEKECLNAPENSAFYIVGNFIARICSESNDTPAYLFARCLTLK